MAGGGSRCAELKTMQLPPSFPLRWCLRRPSVGSPWMGPGPYEPTSPMPSASKEKAAAKPSATRPLRRHPMQNPLQHAPYDAKAPSPHPLAQCPRASPGPSCLRRNPLQNPLQAAPYDATLDQWGSSMISEAKAPVRVCRHQLSALGRHRVRHVHVSIHIPATREAAKRLTLPQPPPQRERKGLGNLWEKHRLVCSFGKGCQASASRQACAARRSQGLR